MEGVDLDHLITRPLPILEAAFYRRDAQTDGPFAFHNHVLQGNALRFMKKSLSPKDVGLYRSTLVQGTSKGKCETLYINETTELSITATHATGTDVLLPFSHVLNISGLGCDGTICRWQLAMSTVEEQVLWQDAFTKGKEYVSLIENSGEKTFLMDIFRAMSQVVKSVSRVHGLKIYNNCFKGSQVLLYLSKKLDYSTSQAYNIASNMLNLRFLEHVDNEHAFHSKLLYRFSSRLVGAGISSLARSGTNLFAILLPVNKVGKDARSETVESDGDTSPAQANREDVTELSPTTVHLLRLRRQTQAELNAAVETIELQQSNIDHLVAMHSRNLEKGDVLLTRLRRVEFLNVALQVLLLIVCGYMFYLKGFGDVVPVLITLIAVCCGALFFVAPIYRVAKVDATKDLLFEDIAFNADIKVEDDKKVPINLTETGNASEDDDAEEEGDDEDEDDEEVVNEFKDGDVLAVEGVDRRVEANSSLKGFNFLRGDFVKLRKIHSFIQRVKTPKTPAAKKEVKTGGSRLPRFAFLGFQRIQGSPNPSR